MNEEQPQPMWPEPERGKYYPEWHPLQFNTTVRDIDIYLVPWLPGYFITVWKKGVRAWSPFDVSAPHPNPPTQRFRAVQKHLRILEALMR